MISIIAYSIGMILIGFSVYTFVTGYLLTRKDKSVHGAWAMVTIFFLLPMLVIGLIIIGITYALGGG